MLRSRWADLLTDEDIGQGLIVIYESAIAGKRLFLEFAGQCGGVF